MKIIQKKLEFFKQWYLLVNIHLLISNCNIFLYCHI